MAAITSSLKSADRLAESQVTLFGVLGAGVAAGNVALVPVAGVGIGPSNGRGGWLCSPDTEASDQVSRLWVSASVMYALALHL